MSNRDCPKNVYLLDHKLFHGGSLLYYSLPAELLVSMIAIATVESRKAIG